MNDQLQEAIKNMLDKSVAAIEKGASFAGDQLPDVIQQYLIWGIVEGVLFVLMAAVVVSISYKAVYKWTDQKDDFGWSGDKFAAAFIGGGASFLICVFALGGIFQIVKIIVAPKLYLLQAAASLLK